MNCAIILAVIALTNGAAVERRSLQVMDDFTLKTFTQLFRQTMLDAVAIEMNKTKDMAADLKTRVNNCQPLIKAKTDSCKSCTQSTCQKDPTLTDYLNFVNPYTYLEGPISDMTGKLGSVVDLLGDGASGFLSSMQGTASSLAGSVTGAASSAFTSMQSAISSLGGSLTDAGSSIVDTANLIGDGLTDLGHSVTDTASNVGHEIEHAGSSIGHAIGSIFGRDLDAQTRACMERCDSCKPLLLPSDGQIVTAVCGDSIVNLNNTIKSRVSKLQNIFNAAVDKNHPVVTKVEFDPTSMNAMMQLSRVFITVNLGGHSNRYQTTVPYNMMALPVTAQKMAVEYMGKVH